MSEHPLGDGHIEGRLGRDDTDVVDQDVDARHSVENLLGSDARADICSDTMYAEFGRNGVNLRGI